MEVSICFLAYYVLRWQLWAGENLHMKKLAFAFSLIFYKMINFELIKFLDWWKRRWSDAIWGWRGTIDASLPLRVLYVCRLSIIHSPLDLSKVLFDNHNVLSMLMKLIKLLKYLMQSFAEDVSLKLRKWCIFRGAEKESSATVLC